MADTVIVEDDFVNPINGQVFDQSVDEPSFITPILLS